MTTSLGMIAALASSLLGQMGPSGGAAAPRLVVTKERRFALPIVFDEVERPRLLEVQLFVSSDLGASWRPYASASPDKKNFEFQATNDGEFWFAIRTKDREGRVFPANLNTIQPEIRVRVDRQPPVVALRAMAINGEEAGAQWEVKDDNLDPTQIRLEFSPRGANQWTAVNIAPRAVGDARWRTGVRGQVDVRLRARDRAENETTQVAAAGSGSTWSPAAPAGGSANYNNPGSLNAGASGFSAPPAPLTEPVYNAIGGGNSNSTTGSATGRLVPFNKEGTNASPGPNPRSVVAAPAKTMLVNSTQFGLKYDVEDVGKSDLSAVTLYYTLDGKTWESYGDDDDRKSPFLVQVDGEGLYGFTMVAKSGVGMGDEPPATGSPPSVWVEVDITPPQVELAPPEPGKGLAANTLSIAWQAGDKNLAPKSISLFYADNPNGPWKPIKSEIENTGRYQWPLTPEVPYKFYVRVEAKDRAGNVGRTDTDKPVVVDLSRPKPKIIAVEPAANPAGKSP